MDLKNLAEQQLGRTRQVIQAGPFVIPVETALFEEKQRPVSNKSEKKPRKRKSGKKWSKRTGG